MAFNSRGGFHRRLIIDTSQNTATSERNLSEIRNLPVVFIENGKEFGRVDSFIIDYSKGVLLGYVLTGKENTGVRVVPPSAVSRYGSFAITVTGKNVVEDVTDSSEFSRIFNNDPDMIGLPVHETEDDNEPVGYIKDASFNAQNCRLTTVMVSNDKGFTSPYYAKINFRDISKVLKNRVVLNENCKINFRRQGVLERASESGGLVPLVIREHDWRKALNERVSEETEKLQKHLIDKLGSEHEKFFLARERDKLKTELFESLKDVVASLFDKRMLDISKSFEADISEKFSAMVEKESLRAILDDVEARFAGAAAGAAKINEDIQQITAGIDARLRERMTSFEESLAEKSLAAVDSAKTRISELADRKLEAIRADLLFKITETEDRLETKLLSLAATVQEFERSAGTATSELKNAIKVSEEAMLKEAYEKAEEMSVAISALNKQVEEIKSAPSPELPDLSAFATKNEIAALKENLASSVDDVNATAAEALSRIDGISTTVSAPSSSAFEFETAKTGIFKNIEKRFEELSENLESKFAETREELDGVATRLFDTIESKINTLVSADKLEERIASAASAQMGDAALVSKIDEIERQLEALSNSERLNSSVHSTSVRHIGELRAELTEKVDSALEKAAALANEIQSGKIYSSINQNAFEDLKKRVAEIFEKGVGESSADLLSRIADLENRLEGALQKEAIESVSDMISTFTAASPLEKIPAGLDGMMEALENRLSGFVSTSQIDSMLSNALKEAGVLDMRRELMDKVDAAVDTFSKAMLKMQLPGVSIDNSALGALQQQIDKLSAIISASPHSHGAATLGEKISGDIVSLAENALEHADERIKDFGVKLNSKLKKYCTHEDITELISAAVSDLEKRLREDLRPPCESENH